MKKWQLMVLTFAPALTVASLYGLSLAAMVSILQTIYPAAKAGGGAALLAFFVLLSMTLFLSQTLFYCPRPMKKRVMFIEGRIVTWPVAFLLFPAGKKLFLGPALSAVTTLEQFESLVEEATYRLNHLSPLARLALLLEGRSPLELFLTKLNNKTKPLILRAPAYLFLLLVSPVRQISRLLGYFSAVSWGKWAQMPPISPLMNFKRRLAFQLVAWAETLSAANNETLSFYDLDDESYAQLLVDILCALGLAHNNPHYGEVEGPQASIDPNLNGQRSLQNFICPTLNPPPPLASFPAAGPQFLLGPQFKPKFQGVFMNLPITLKAPRFIDMYDRQGEQLIKNILNN
ncbi:MAG: hypothetical protein ACRCTY_05470, partial [Candidatus Adiutrix sp.]